MKRYIGFALSFADIYVKKKIPRASAALSYYLTMSVFPMIICLYSLLGNNYEKAIEALDFTKHLIAPETAEALEDFFEYVASNNSTAMLAAGIALLITSASAAVRCLQTTIGEFQGGQRFQGLAGFVFSMAFALILMLVMYLCILLMFFSRDVIDWLNINLPRVDISRSWLWFKYIIMFVIVFLVIVVIYEVSRRRTDRYSTVPGALVASVAMVIICYVFALFIGTSVRYPLVYGSIASVVLLMFWLHFMCMAIFCGAAFNIVLRDQKARRLREKTQN